MGWRKHWPRSAALRAVQLRYLGPGHSKAINIRSSTTVGAGLAGHAEHFWQWHKCFLMKENFLMCKMPEILLRMPVHSAKPLKTHMKRTESGRRRHGGKSLLLRDQWAAELLPAEPTTPRPLPHSLVFDNEPEKL